MKDLFGKGVWSLGNSPISIRVLANQPEIDFIIFDQEHSHSSFKELIGLTNIVQNQNKKSGIRLSEISQAEFLKVYEIFPDLVMIPGITDQKQVL